MLDREMARELLRQMVIAETGPLVEAQIASAKGVKYLVVREKNGTFKPVTDVKARLAANNGDEIFEIWEKFPNVQAFQELMDRTLDKPSQSLAVNATVTVDVTERLVAARKRLNEALKRG